MAGDERAGGVRADGGQRPGLGAVNDSHRAVNVRTARHHRAAFGHRQLRTSVLFYLQTPGPTQEETGSEGDEARLDKRQGELTGAPMHLIGDDQALGLAPRADKLDGGLLLP